MELLASLDIPFYFLIHQTPAWFICVEKAPFSKSNVEKGKIILESGFGRTTAHGLLLWFAIVAIVAIVAIYCRVSEVHGPI